MSGIPYKVHFGFLQRTKRRWERTCTAISVIRLRWMTMRKWTKMYILFYGASKPQDTASASRWRRHGGYWSCNTVLSTSCLEWQFSQSLPRHAVLHILTRNAFLQLNQSQNHDTSWITRKCKMTLNEILSMPNMYISWTMAVSNYTDCCICVVVATTAHTEHTMRWSLQQRQQPSHL